MFREERHELLREVIDDIVYEVDRSDPTMSLAADLLPVAFDLYARLDLPFGEVESGRTRRDVYTSALRALVLGMPNSFLLTSVMEMVGLGKLAKQLEWYADVAAASVRVASLLQRESEAYDRAYDEALSVASRFEGAAQRRLPSLYASMSAWRDEERLTNTAELMLAYEFNKISLVIEGPLQMVLEIGPEGALAVWRALVWKGGRDEEDLSEARKLVEDVFGLIDREAKEGVMAAFTSLLGEAMERLAGRWLYEQMELRSLVPEGGRDRFMAAYRDGVYFRRATLHTTDSAETA